MNDQEIQTLTITEPSDVGYEGQCKIVYPASSVEGETGSVQVHMGSVVVQYAIYYAKSLEMDQYGNIQEYMLDTDPNIPISASVVSKFANDPDVPVPDDPEPEEPEDPEEPEEPEEGTLRIVKLEEGTDKPLEGAVFEVISPNGDVLGSFSTDDEGIIEIPDIEVGNYTITELVPPEDHLLPERTTQNVTVSNGGTAEVTFWNAPYGNLRVEKISDTGEPLKGVTIQIKHIASGATQSGKTNTAGVIEFTDLKPGGYEVRELAGIGGWQADTDTVQTVSVVTGETSTVTITNKELPGLRILKYDRTTLKVMSDVTFEIWKDGTSLGQFKTDQMGEILLLDAQPGTYLVKEVQSDDEHIVDTTPQQIELKAGDGIRELVFFNDLKPGMRLIKVDSANPTKVIPNAVFEIKSVDGSYGPKEFTTDQNGEIDLSKLPTGAYVVTEKECPGYVIDQAQRIIQLNANETAQFVFTNSKRPTFTLVKLDSYDSTPLSGVTFRIAKIEDGTHYLDRVTDTRGRIFVEDLEPGIYSVTEIDVPEGYVKNEKEWHVELFPGKNSELVVTNDRKSDLTIRKIDKDTGEPIPGVTFTLCKVDGATITTKPTGMDGTVTIQRLEPGVYTVTEQRVPDGYILDTTPQMVTLFPNRNASVQFQNYKRPTLTIHKIDLNGQLLTGAIFEIKTKAGVKIGDFPVDKNGTVTISNVHLDEGWYLIREIQAPEGYILDSTPHEVYLRPGKTTEVRIQNEKKPGLTIYKIDSVTGSGVKGAKFEIYVSKDKNENGTFQKLNSSYYYSDENGIIHLENLDTGWYRIVEMEPAAGYSMKEPSEQVIYVEHDAAVDVTFENTPLNGIVVEKYDSVTGKALQGAAFQLRYLGGTSGTGGTVIGQKVTDKNGVAAWTGLEPGTYIVEEVDAAEGYSIIQSSETVFLADNGEQSVITVRFANMPDGVLLIRKVCSVNPGVTLPNAEFKVTYADGTLVGDSNGIFRTDAYGEIRIEGLKPGKSVVVTEIKAPYGYIIDSQSQTVQIKEGRVVSLTFKNQPKGGILIQKRDSITGLPLFGAQFRVTTATGCEVGLDGVIGTATLTQNGLFTTDHSGEIRISNLDPGAYVITEIKAPVGYVMDTPSTNVVVGNNGEVQTVVITNTPKGNLIVTKYDSVTRTPVAGAEFKITTARGEYVSDNEGQTSSNGIYTTDANGQIVLSKLNPNTYVVTEVKAPDGYHLNSKTETVVVAAGETQNIAVYNEPLCSLTITKLDSVTGKPVPGTVFAVKDGDGALLGTYTTGKDGTVTVTGLIPGSTVVVSETKVPDGYVLNTRPQTIIVKNGTGNSVTSGQPSVMMTSPSPSSTSTSVSASASSSSYSSGGNDLTFENDPTTTLIIQKFIDGTENEPLSGVAFKVVDGRGVAVGTDDGVYYTDKAGEIVLDGLEPGTTVVAREIKTVEGYVLDGTPQSIYIKAGDAQRLTFWNKRAGELVVVKKDKLTGEPLAGVEFQLTYAGGGYVDNANGHLSSNGLYTTDANGEIRISGVVGTIVVKETKTIPGYIIDEATRTQTVTVNPDDMQTLMFYNIPTQTLTIQKYVDGTTDPIEGVTFLVTDSSGAVVGVNDGEYVTDKNGRITLTDLVPGTTITAREIKTVDGFVLDGTPQSILIKSSDAQQLTFLNKKTGTLLIEKLDSITEEPLTGAQFKVTYEDGRVVDTGEDKLSSEGIYTTDSNGQFRIPSVTGTIVVTEEKAPDGYVIDNANKSQTVVVEPNEVRTLRFYNEPLCSLTITKKDSVTGKPVPGTVFEVKDAGGNPLGTYTTGKDGTVTVTGLVPGSAVVVTEVKVPDGYVLNSKPQTVVVKNGDGNSVTSNTSSNSSVANNLMGSSGNNDLTFENDPTTTLIIQKYIDGTENEPLSGVAFKVVDGSGAAVGPDAGVYYTDKAGEIVLDGLEPGTTIVAREIKTVEGFVLDGTPQNIRIKAGEAQRLTFWNKRAGELVIVKKDKLTGEPLAGVEFQLTYAGGGYVDNANGHLSSKGLYTTDANGEIRISGVVGTIVVKETKTIPGYVIDPAGQTQTVTVNPDDTQSLMFYNIPTQTLTIQKYVNGTTDPVEGVTFLVTDSSGAVVGVDDGEYVTDKNGRIVLTGLVPGTTITAKEIKTVDGFVLDGTPQSILIKSGDAQQLTFLNKKTGTLFIEKLDSVTNKPLAGAQFKVTYEDGRVVDTGEGKLSSEGIYKTDSNGLIQIVNVVGTIVVTEEKAPDGYVIDSDNKSQTVVVNPEDIKVVQFHNEPLCSLTITKKDSVTGKPVPGTVFEVKDAGGNLLGSYTTGKDGTVTVNGLIPGSTVVVTETKVPEGYVLNTTPQTIVVKNGSGSSATSNRVSGFSSNNLTFENNPTSTLIIHKYIEGTENEPLSGVAFKVVDGSGKAVGPNDGVYYTDKVGEIVLDGLEPGMTVVAREIKTAEGYVLDGTPQDILIETGKAQNLTFWNKRAGELVIQKKDKLTNAPLAGVEFQLTYAGGGYVDNANGHLSSNGLYTTDANGEIRISGVIGTIVVKETKTIPGYIIDEATRTQTVTVNPDDTQTLTFYNIPTQTLTIQKYVDGTTEPIQGVTFLVTDSSGTLLGTSNGEYVTDKNGRIVLTDLIPGTTITAKEIKTVDGFVLDGTPQDILIKSGDGQQLTFWNKKNGTLLIEKLDSVTNKPLAGAQFKVIYMDGGAVDSKGGIYTTDSNGQVRIPDVTGTVVVTEEKAPEGYVMDAVNKSRTVVVNPNEVQNVRFYNEPLCSLTITKLDSVTGKPVPGTVFTVKDGNGTVLGTYTTGKDGTVTVNGLISGSTVVVTETKVPEGYVLNTTPQTIVVKNGSGNSVTGSVISGSGGSTGNNSLVFENAPTSTLIIHKYIEGTANEPLSGVAFKVVDGSGAAVGSSDGEFYTDKAGEIVVDGIDPGTTITVREIKTVDGFVLDGTPKTITVEEGKAAELTFWNKKAGELVIQKKDKKTNAPLAGVEFQLTYAGGGYVDNANGHLSSNGIYTTDTNGEIRISGVVGTIVVKETKTIPGYIIDEATRTQTVTVNPDDTQTLTFYNIPTQTLTIQKYVDGTTDPIQGVTFLVTDSSGAVLGTNNGEYVTDRNGRIVLTDLTPGVTITAKEVKTVEGYVLDTTPQSILIKSGEAQTLTFFNKEDGGLELIKVNEADKTQRISGTTFEICRMDGGLVETVTTGKNGRVYVSLDAGTYYAVEIEAAEGFKLDNTPHYFEVEDGKTTTLTVTNKPFSGIILHKIDSVSREGIYDVKFVLYDANKKPIGEYSTDNEGYIYLDDLTVSGTGSKTRFYLRELEAAEGYVLDEEYKTVYIQPGETIEIEWVRFVP